MVSGGIEPGLVRLHYSSSSTAGDSIPSVRASASANSASGKLPAVTTILSTPAEQAKSCHRSHYVASYMTRRSLTM